MNKFLLVFGLAFTFVFGQASAESTWHSSKIKQVYPLSNGDVVLTFFQD